MKRNIVFCICFILIITIVPIIIIVSPKKDISEKENRMLTTFDLKKSFTNGELQSNIEDTLLDQMLLASEIKDVYNHMTSDIRFFTSDVVFKNQMVFHITKGICMLKGDKDYLIYCPKYFEDYENNLRINSDIINDVSRNNPNIKVKVFRIRTDDDIFINEKVDNYMSSKLEVPYASLSFVNDYNDFREYFFQTDHHWNYKGAFLGYKEVIDFLGKNSTIKPLETVCFEDASFAGSRTQLTGIDMSEEFCVYRYDYPTYRITVHGSDDKLGHMEDYFNGNYKKVTTTTHYTMFYGGGFGEAIIENVDIKEKDSILLIADSMTDSISRLIASNYYKTYIIDLRRYEKYLEKSFDINDYIKENDIQNVLFIGNIRFIGSDDFIPKLRK